MNHGPEFLWQSEENRLTKNMISITCDTLQENPKVKKTSCLTTYTNESSLAKALKYFSKYHCAKLASAICLR